MPTYLKKDITTVETGIIAHGVNCQHAMGSGVAKAIKEKWPKVYQSFMRTHGGKEMLGTAHLINVNSDPLLHVANCYTQVFYGHGGRFASPRAIEKSLDSLASYSKTTELPLYIPKIGAGLGGLKWDTEVEPIISKLEKKYQIEIFVCEL